MGKWKHFMLSVDREAGTGVCNHCGEVALGWKNIQGERVPRCGIAVKEQRNTPGRNDPIPWKTFRRAHGLTGVEARLAREGKACEMCGSTESLRVDHSHASGKLRGILCNKHNTGLGFFHDSIEELEAGIAYLRAHDA